MVTICRFTECQGVMDHQLAVEGLGITVLQDLEGSAFHHHLTAKSGVISMIKTDTARIHRKTAVTTSRGVGAEKREVKVETEKVTTHKPLNRSEMLVGVVWTIICILVIKTIVDTGGAGTLPLMCGK